MKVKWKWNKLALIWFDAAIQIRNTSVSSFSFTEQSNFFLLTKYRISSVLFSPLDRKDPHSFIYWLPMILLKCNLSISQWLLSAFFIEVSQYISKTISICLAVMYKLHFPAFVEYRSLKRISFTSRKLFQNWWSCNVSWSYIVFLICKMIHSLFGDRFVWCYCDYICIVFVFSSVLILSSAWSCTQFFSFFCYQPFSYIFQIYYKLCIYEAGSSLKTCLK